jgi:hypothetical protein
MHAVGVDAGEYIHVGESRLAPGCAQGAVNEASWDLTFTQDTPLFTYQALEFLYRWPVPRNKSLAMHPVAKFSGTFSFGGETFEIDGWPGMVGHNWGAEHPEEWIWLHGTFPDEDAWFDGTVVRLKVGGRALPWIANGCLNLDGQQYRVGGPGKPRRPLTTVERTRCVFTMRGADDLTVRGTVEAPADHFVAWRYSDPFGGEHITTNSSVAAMTLDVSRPGREDLRLHVPAGAAYELGSYGEPAGIPVQSFPDP